VAKKKYTRKQLKQPDKFLSFSDRAWGVVRRNYMQVIAMLVVASLIIAGAWIWTNISDSKAKKTTEELTRAVEIYSQSVIPMETKVPEDKDAVPRFKTRQAKLKAASEAFTTVVDEGRGELSQMALLLRAGVRFDQAQYTEAMGDYKAFLKHSEDPRLRPIALENLGFCYEATRSLDEALSQFRALQKEQGSYVLRGKYHEARILALKGDKKKAASLLREVMDSEDSGSLAERAAEHLALLEGK
jgi:predicted negative regulator of RcsB-dependent stress response